MRIKILIGGVYLVLLLGAQAIIYVAYGNPREALTLVLITIGIFWAALTLVKGE